jgi:NOL1/NOP2/fmu family ribosome biogenesis protein
LPAFFDLIVVDAPCSGSGLFRKDPDAINEWSEDNVQLCSQRQQRILADVLPTLNTEGILIYSTCSYSEVEDEMIADWLVEEMGMESIRIPIDINWGIIETESGKHKSFGYRFFPNLIKGEGLYLSAFKKRSSSDSIRLKETKLSLPNKSELETINAFIRVSDSYIHFKQSETVRIYPNRWFIELKQLAQCLYIKKAGIAIGAIKGKDVIPDHELAVSILPKNELPLFELNKEQALQFLRRKDLLLPDAPKGWCLLQFSGLPLGWAQVLPNRLNNYYPAEWRILKE